MNTVRFAHLAAAALLAPLAAGAQQAQPAPTKGGAVNVSACTGCHGIPGYQASFPRVYRVPKIAGQSEKYIEAALHAYQKGDRDHPTMRAIARGLSDNEIAALAAHYAGRGGDAK